MRKKEFLTYGAIIVVAIVFLGAEFSSAMPTTTTTTIEGKGVIDRTIEIQSAKGSYGLSYQSDMRTPSLGYYGISQVDFFEKIVFGEGNETYIVIDGKYSLDNVYRLTDVKNYDVGTRYK
ncbi:MAG: hypothetical protein IMF19_04830, partial [Proteobacteria bacterium]|nr:hypothetical protein [Pseudomonadota bacterium]